MIFVHSSNDSFVGDDEINFDMCVECDVNERELCAVCVIGASRLPAGMPNLIRVSPVSLQTVDAAVVMQILIGCLLAFLSGKGIGSTLSLLSK